MPDHMTPEQRSRTMKRVKLKNGSLERVVHQELKARCLKFRRHVRSLPGSPDIVFNDSRVAIFVDGDFWHGWRLPTWERILSQFWREKLRANRNRDQRNFRKLRSLGWQVVRIWQHQLVRSKEGCIERIMKTLHSIGRVKKWDRLLLSRDNHSSRPPHPLPQLRELKIFGQA